MNEMYKLVFVFRNIEVPHGRYTTIGAAIMSAYFHAQYVGANEFIIYKDNKEVAIIRG